MNRQFLIRAASWIGVYILFVSLPLLALFLGPVQPGRGFWSELAVGLGCAGIAMMGFQFFLTGRFRRITPPYGIDVVYHFHRLTSTIGQVAAGTRAYLDRPYGSFSVDRPPAPVYVFLAPGVGTAPVMSILRNLADRCDLRPLLLFSQGKNGEEATSREEQETTTCRLDLEVVHGFSRPEQDREGERGLLSVETLTRAAP